MPIIKHGAHRIWLTQAATAASGTTQTEIPYDYLYGNYGVYDSTLETIVRGTMVAQAAWVAGDAITLNHYSVAGALVDAVSIGTTAAAHVPFDFTASTASTGNSIIKGWQMQSGDSLELVVAATTTAGTRGPLGVALLIDSRGA